MSAWQAITNEPMEITERLITPGGRLYRTIVFGSHRAKELYLQGRLALDMPVIALVFVPGDLP